MARPEKPNISVYELDASGKYVKSRESEPAIAVQDSAIVTSEMSEEKARILRGNPFMYNPETSAVSVYSLEDFLVTYKKKEYVLGDVIRNPAFPLRIRRKIFKKNFKAWHKDYVKNKRRVFRENYRTVEVVKSIGNVKFSIYVELAIWAMLVAMVFITGIDSPLWERIAQGRFGLFMKTTLTAMYASASWLRIVANISIYLLVALIFYSLFFRLIIRDYRKYYRAAHDYLDRSETKINRDYKKKRKKAYRYYLRYLKKNASMYYPPLDISEVQEGEVNIRVFDIVSKATVNKSYRIMKWEPFLKITKTALLFLSIAGLVIVYGYGIVYVIIAAL
ncbi:MAG TPA: hypothetical protein GX390_01525 [Acholeplasmataceae bacterium]|nr:hypothetical protein [Acholeplasmataceae bacterium]